MKWMHQMMIPLTLMCWCVMSLDVGKLWMQPPTTQLVHYIIPDVSVWCGGVFIFVSLGEMCSFQNASSHELRHKSTNHTTWLQGRPGDRWKKYFMMMRSLGPWEIAFLLLKSSRLRKWCIVWDVCRLKCVACTLKLSVVSILSPFYETKTHCFSNPEVPPRLCDVNNTVD